MSSDETRTPPQAARRWKCKPAKVIGFIRSGELRAFDISTTPGVGRPKYLITMEAILEFEQRRQPKPPPTKRKRRRPSTDVIQFIQ